MKEKFRIRPLKRLGQNFLTDRGAIKRVIEAANLQLDDIVLEIGPGTGALTKELAKKVKKVVAIEKDPKMIEILKETLKDFQNVEVVPKDVLKIENWELIENWKLKIGNFKIVANLPFYLTAPVIRKFLESENPPREMILVVQKEVGQRICPPSLKLRRAGAKPKMNLLAISVQFYATPKIISYISKKSFWPSPKVDSAIIKISALNQRKKSAFNQRFFKIVKAGFSHPRKQLINNLSKGLEIDREEVKSWLLKNNVQPSQRAETLSMGDWINLLQSCRIN